MLISKYSLSQVLCCNLVHFSHRMESKVSFEIEISGLFEGYENFLCMCSRAREITKTGGVNIMGHPVYGLGIEARVVKVTINYLAVKAATICMSVC